MSESKRKKIQPDYTVAPGEILAEALGERGMSPSGLEQRIGLPLKTINEIFISQCLST